MPRRAPLPRPSPDREPTVSRTAAPPEDPRGEMRTLLGVDKSLTDTCLGMLRYGLVRRVGRGKYVAVEPSRHD
jgi:hypothetical protein